jgi:hypothetical protein
MHFTVRTPFYRVRIIRLSHFPLMASQELAGVGPSLRSVCVQGGAPEKEERYDCRCAERWLVTNLHIALAWPRSQNRKCVLIRYES